MSKATLRRALQNRGGSQVEEPRRRRQAYVPPTDQQLEDFVFVVTSPERGPHLDLGLRIFAIKEALRIPSAKEDWLRRHREFQEQLWVEIEQRRRG